MKKGATFAAHSKRGAEAFERFYRQRFGIRWPSLKEALLDSPAYRVIEGLSGFYGVDGASVEVVASLSVKEDDDVLDMCAAPGGKSLLIAQLLISGSLVSNDLSAKRRIRLSKSLNLLPNEKRSLVTIRGVDAALFGRKKPESFTRILLDAPCSAERHTLNSPQYLSEWHSGRIKRLARKQFSLLCSAYDALKPGGTLVYATCALCHEENDDVIEKLLRKRNGICITQPEDVPTGEATQFGIHILPDKCNGLGPSWRCRLTKKDDIGI